MRGSSDGARDRSSMGHVQCASLRCDPRCGPHDAAAKQLGQRSIRGNIYEAKRTATLLTLSAAALLCAVLQSGPQRRSARGRCIIPSRAAAEVEVTRVVAQKLNTTVKLPAQLTAYEIVDVYPKVTGFVKWIKVDRGSRVRTGEAIAQLEAPELLAQRAEAESKFQSAESQLSAAQAKFTADQATYQRMSAAAKTPGVVAQNDLEIAQKTSQADQANVEALAKSAKAAQEALQAVSQLEAYLSITAPFDGQVTNRYVHPGALVGPGGGPGAMTRDRADSNPHPPSLGGARSGIRCRRNPGRNGSELHGAVVSRENFSGAHRQDFRRRRREDAHHAGGIGRQGPQGRT